MNIFAPNSVFSDKHHGIWTWQSEHHCSPYKIWAISLPKPNSYCNNLCPTSRIKGGNMNFKKVSQSWLVNSSSTISWPQTWLFVFIYIFGTPMGPEKILKIVIGLYTLLIGSNLAWMILITHLPSLIINCYTLWFWFGAQITILPTDNWNVLMEMFHLLLEPGVLKQRLHFSFWSFSA